MVFLCAASVLSLNSSLYKLDVWQLKGLGGFHADVVAVGPALVVVSAGRRDASELRLRRSLASAFHHYRVTHRAFSSQQFLQTQHSRHAPWRVRAHEGHPCVCFSRSHHLCSNTIRFNATLTSKWNCSRSAISFLPPQRTFPQNRFQAVVGQTI